MNLIRFLLVLFQFCGLSLQSNTNVLSDKSTRYVNPSHYPNHGKSRFRQMEEYLAETVNNFKLEFHRSFEESRLKLKQRNNYLFSLPDKGVLVEEHLKVENVSQTNTNVLSNYGGNGQIRMWTVIENSHYTYLLWGHSNGLIVLSEFKVTPIGSHIIPLAQYIEKGNGVPLKAQAFLYESMIWIVVAFQSLDREYLAVYQFNPNVRTFHRRQTIETDIRSDFDITTKGITYMAVSSYMKRTPVGQTLQTTLRLYEWRHTQFDFIAEQKTFSATSVRLFNMAGILYMAVSQTPKPKYNQTMSHTIDFYNQYPVLGSPVFLYNAREDEKLTYVQIIPNFAVKVEHFRVDGSDYLVFVDSNDISRIYWWGGDQFLIYQDLIETRNAISVAVKRLPNAEIVLAFLYADRVKFYTESINSKYTLNGHLVIPEPLFTDIKLFTYQMNYFAVFTFKGLPKTPISSVWKLSLVKHEIQEDIDYDPLRTCLSKLEQTLTKREEDLRQLTARADRVWLANRSQNVSAPVIIRGKLRTKSITGRTLFITNGNKKVPQISNTDVKIRADQLSNKLDAIANDMNNLVFRSANQTIIGRTTFSEPISAGHSNIKNIVNRDLLLNRIPFNFLTENSLTIDGNQVINAHFSFNSIKVDNFVIRGPINDLNISDALLADTPLPQVVTGTHRYRNLILNSNLILNKQFGSLNGIFPDHFVTKSGINQLIGGQKVFQTLDAKHIDVKGNTNGRDLSDIANRAVHLNGANQVITGQLVMDSPISVNRIALKGLINRVVNVSEIAFNAVTVYGEQRITGEKTFRGPVNVLGGVEVGGKVNAIKLSRDVITTNTQQVITGNLLFKSFTNFLNNLDSNSINGIDLSEECVRRNASKPQFLNQKVFNRTLIVLNDITMDSRSTMDGVDPSELQNLVIRSKNTAFESPVTFNRLSVSGNIFSKTINHLLINDLPKNVWLKTVNQTIKVPVVFEGILKTRRLSSPNVNGFSVPNDFLHKYLAPNEVIFAQKRFDNNVVINGNLDIKEGKLMNGIDLNAFERQTIKRGNNFTDIIGGGKHFRSIRVLGNLMVAKVNALNISSDIMLTNSVQTINGNIRLMGPTTHINGRLEVMSNINVKTTVNNISLSQFANDMILIHRTPQPPHRQVINKVFAVGIGVQHIKADGVINGIDINEMKSRVVTLNTEQQIHSEKNFTSNTVFSDNIISDYLNGLKINEFVKRVVLNNNKITVRGLKTFNGNVLIKSDVELSGTISGIDCRSLQRRIMSRTRNNVILAPMLFTNDINLGHLSLESPATIDGLNPNELAFIGPNLKLNGNIVFNSNVSVRTDIHVNKLVNGCDLRQLAINAVLHDTKTHIQNIVGTKQFNNLEILGNLTIYGLINNIDINRLAAKIVTKTGDQVLTAPLTFQRDVIVDRLIVRNLINGQNISLLFNDMVLKSKLQTITSRKTFLKPLLANGSRTQVDGYVNVDGLVNGINVVKLNQTSVKQDWNQVINGKKTFSGRMTFKRDVFIGGALTGIQIPKHLILVNTNELISGSTTFHNQISAQRDLNVNKLIDGLDLSYFVANRLTLNDGNESITSVLNFTNRVSVDKLTVKKTINNIPINAFVTRNGRHYINGLKIFLNDLYVNGNLHSPGIYNTINIHNLVNRAVSIRRPEVITGITEFTAPVSMQHMVITGLLNGYDISDMANFHKRYTAEVDSLLANIKQQLNRQENVIHTQFASHLNDRSFGIAYFIVSKQFYETGERHLNNSYESPIFNARPIVGNLPVQSSDGQRFVVFANESSSKIKPFENDCNTLYTQPMVINIYRFNGFTFEYFQTIDINGVISLDKFQVSDQTYIVAASRLLGTTFIIQLRGYNKFEIILKFPTPGVESVKTFWSSDGNLHLAIRSSKSGQTKIMTAIMNGPHNVKKYSSIEELLIAFNFV